MSVTVFVQHISGRSGLMEYTHIPGWIQSRICSRRNASRQVARVRTCWDRFCKAVVKVQLLHWFRQVLYTAGLCHLFRSSSVSWLASDVVENSGRVAYCRFWYAAAAALLQDILF